jgi:hypothetical protein
MESPARPLRGAAAEDGEASGRDPGRPRDLVRLREGAGDGRLGERPGDAAGEQLLAKALAAEPPAARPRLGPRRGEGTIIDVAPHLQFRHDRARDVGRRAPPAETARELPPRPGFPREEIERDGARPSRGQDKARGPSPAAGQGIRRPAVGDAPATVRLRS